MPSELEGFIFSSFSGENRILGCLGSILEASWVVLAKFLGLSWPPRRPAWAPRRPQDEPKTPPRRLQDGSRRLQDGPRWLKTAQDMPKRPPRCPKTPPRWPKSPILQDFATQDGAMLPKLQGLAVIAAGVGNYKENPAAQGICFPMPCWNAPRCLQDDPKTRQEPPKSAQEPPKTPQDP